LVLGIWFLVILWFNQGIQSLRFTLYALRSILGSLSFSGLTRESSLYALLFTLYVILWFNQGIQCLQECVFNVFSRTAVPSPFTPVNHNRCEATNPARSAIPFISWFLEFGSLSFSGLTRESSLYALRFTLYSWNLLIALLSFQET
jgi:hypothetical protein